MRLPIVLLSALALSMPGSASAQEHEPQSPWAFATADEEGYQETMDKASGLAFSAVSIDAEPELRSSVARMAVRLFEKAAEINPKSAEPHYRAAETLSAVFLRAKRQPPNELRKAIEHWRLFQKKAPLDPRLTEVLDARSIALTKLGGLENLNSNLKAAIADYDLHLQLIDKANGKDSDRIATVISNRAELYMMLGDLNTAIEGYEQSIAVRDDVLAGYGLAVALDRDSQRTRARDVARSYAQSDTQNSKLTRDGTFYVPRGEAHYYFAMRYEGLGDYRKAVAQYEEFLRLLPKSPWAPMARRNLSELRPKAAKQSPAPSRGLPVLPSRKVWR